MPPAVAIIAAAAIGGGASLIAANSTKNAAKDTAAANNALTADVYNQNKATLTPFISTGAAANQAQAGFLGVGGNASGAAPFDAQAFIAANPKLAPGLTSTYASNQKTPGYNETFPQFIQRQIAQSPATYANAVYPAAPTAPASGPTDPGLQQFEASSGTAPQVKAISGTLGSNLNEYLDNTGQAQPTKQLTDAAGSSFGDFENKSGTAADMAANDQLLGIGNGGYSTYLDNSGISKTNDAIDKFLGIGAGGGGLNDFLNSTGFNFTLDTGADAVQRSKAAAGLLKSGATAKDLTQYGEQLAQTYGQNYLNALGTYGTQLQGQAQGYSGLVGNQTSAQAGLYTNYENALTGVANLKQNQASAFTGGQANLAGINLGLTNAYLGQVGDVANRGLSAGNALAGVGTNMVNQTSANNNNALSATAGANASTANTINGTLNNAVSAYAYLQKPQGGAAAPTPAQAWTGA